MNKKIMSTALITILSSGLNIYATELNKTDIQDMNIGEVSTRSVERSVSTGKVNTTNLNVRSGNSTSYSVITTISKNTVVQILDDSGEWFKISVNNKTGWVNGKYITKIASTTTKTGTITTDGLNVRKGPSTSYSSLGYLHKGNKVTIYQTSNGWHKITYNGKDGWVSGKYVTVGSTTTNTTTTTPSTNTSKDNIISSGTVTADSLNIRKGNSTSYAIIGKLSKGTKVDIYETSNGWHKISYNGGYGWVSANYINKGATTTTKKGVIHTYDVKLRQTASYSANSLATIKKNTTVEVISGDSTWTKVKYNGQEGYVLTSYININGTVSSTPSTPEYKTGTITTNGLNVRSGASTSFGIIGSLNKGDKVSVISTESNGWHKVKLSNGKTGYVSGNYVTFGELTNTGNHPVSKKLIAIDLGHQLPINAGAVGIKKEDTVVKEVGDRLISKLRANGYNVINVTPTSASSISNSLSQRANKANSAGADVFMSIHFNAASSPSANGAEVFYATESGSSSLAKEILDEIVELGFRNRGIKNGSNLAVLRQSKMTGVLIECAFVTSQTDMNRYNPNTMADAIFDGLVDYLK